MTSQMGRDSMGGVMKAVGYLRSYAISNSKAFEDFVIPMPEVGENDLLVCVKAVSVNPIDIKTRLNASPQNGKPRILGFDACGIVEDFGANVQGFKKGDSVFYAGMINRPGSNSDFQTIDYRIVAHKPVSLDYIAAAAMPLTALTAYEMLFDRLNVKNAIHKGKNALLINAGAGGVGSIAIQLAKKLTDLTIIATASRPESSEWCRKMGADVVIDHRKPFAGQLEAHGIKQVAFIFSNAHSDGYLPQYTEILAPQGRLGLIDSPKTFDINPLKAKSISVHWESMFTRSLYMTDDIRRQGQILAHVAELLDNGKIQPTLTRVMRPMNAATLREAHQLIETNRSVGKIVIENS